MARSAQRTRLSQLACLFFITLASLAYANGLANKQLTYLEFHDPGWMLMLDESGREITADFYYELIQYEDISTWKPNEQLMISLTEEHGVQITRQGTGESYTVVFQDYDPIEDALQSCLSKSSGSSMEIGQCYAEPIRYWKGQARSLLNHLSESSAPALVAALQLEQQSWELYQQTRNAAIEELLKDSWGAIQIIKNAEDSYFQAKSRTQSLLRYF